MEIQTTEKSTNFIEEIINEDLGNGKNAGRVHTRFPPEPNGCLHIGHAKSICLNFSTAAKYGGLCNLRFDDTNPTKEDVEYVDSIQEDIRWLGFDWADRLYYASDYFEKIFDGAVALIKVGKAYICDLTAQEMREHRGTLTEPGKDSPYRDRTIEENLDLFIKMREGKFPDGCRVLRARIDMASPNLNMRDPALYRILRATHHRTRDQWCIYPMYDFAHPISDALEGITHSICTLEFEAHRPLYDWTVENLDLESKPRQIEFARLNLTHTIMSKRYFKQLVEGGFVEGWDDPRMPTISGLRRRGYTPEAIRNFCERIGVAKSNSIVDIAMLEHCIREDLNTKAPRVMAVLRPLKLIIDNYPEGVSEQLPTDNDPENPDMGSRMLPFSRELYIEQEDFCENPPKKYFRLVPGQEVRLKSAYIITCGQAVKDPETGEILEVHCTYDKETRSGEPASGKKIKGTIHWVSAAQAVAAEVRLYDYLLLEESGEEGESCDFKDRLNPASLVRLTSCLVEPSLAQAPIMSRYQFLRQGYFCIDKESKPGHLIFNRIVGLRDSWTKSQKV